MAQLALQNDPVCRCLRFNIDAELIADPLHDVGRKDDHAFAYFDRDLGVRTVLAMRKMKNHGPYKPYAIIDKFSFEATIGELKKGTPL